MAKKKKARVKLPQCLTASRSCSFLKITLFSNSAEYTNQSIVNNSCRIGVEELCGVGNKS